MEPYVLSIEFDVARRIGWSEDDLGIHLDAVIERLRQADGVREIEAEADLDTGRTHLTIHLLSPEPDPLHHSKLLLSVAVRSCGGGHNGLLPLGEEAALKPGRNSWSGLRIPTWNVRQVTFEPDSIDV